MCNLTCQGCSSASDIVKDTQSDPTMESIFTSIENLAKYVEPESVDLMGGELLLYWDRVEQIVPKIREHFPNTRIGMVTNGLLLDKYKDRLLALCEKYHPCDVDITDHFTLFSSDITAKKFHKKLDDFVATLNQGEVIRWEDPRGRLERYKDSTQIDDWKRIMIRERNYSNDYTNVKVTNPQEFMPCYTEANGQIKPHATNDPQGSYTHGCAMPWCYTLVDSKLYKCSWFVVLPKILEKHNQLDDLDWAKYLAYAPVDLTNPTEQALINFENNSLRGISLCDMCSNNPNTNIKQTKDNVLNQ